MQYLQRHILKRGWLIVAGMLYSCGVSLHHSSNKYNTLHKNRPDIASLLKWPTDGIVTSYFGTRHGRPHEGIDISSKEGTPIYAAESGIVIFSGYHAHGYGNLIVIQHNEQLVTVYAHNAKNLVQEKTHVKRGQLIAYVGQTGRAAGAHVHFEVRDNKQPKNPLSYLPN